MRDRFTIARVDNVELQLVELRRLANLLFEHLDEQGVETLIIEEDYYWSIPPRGEFDDIGGDQPKLDIGQVSEDWEFLQEMATSGQLVGAGFGWLAVLLRVLGQQHPF